MKAINIVVEANPLDVYQEIELIETVQTLVKNITIENLQLLAEKSKKAGINKKIQTYKSFM